MKFPSHPYPLVSRSHCQSGRRTLLKFGALAPLATAGASYSGFVFAADRPLRITRNSDISNLDPIAGNSGWDHSFLWTIYESLIDFDDETLLPRPGIADFEFSDQTTLLLKLRPNVRFHDGTPCDAAAVKVNLDRSRGHEVSNIKADLNNLAEIEVLGSHELALRLRQPDFTLPAVLSDRAGMMVSPAAIAEFEKTGKLPPVGAGPWMFDKWIPNDKFIVKKNKDYWRPGFPKAESLEFTIIQDYSAQLRALTAGESDFAYRLPPRFVPLIQKNKNLDSSATTSLLCLQLYFNWNSGPIKEKKVRQAINFALDRKAFVQSAYQGYAEPAHMQMPASHWAYDPATAELYPHDLEKARQLLKEAGYADGVEIQVAGYNRSDTLRYNAILTEQLAKAGIKCNFVTGLGASDINNDFWGKKKYDALLSWWTGRPDPAITYKQMYSSDGYFNAARIDGSPEIARLLLENQRVAELGERKKILGRLQRAIMEEGLSAPIAFEYQVAAYGHQVTGYKPNLQGKPKFGSVNVN